MKRIITTTAATTTTIPTIATTTRNTVIHRFSTILKNWKGVDLKKTSQDCGITYRGTKSATSIRLANACYEAHHFRRPLIVSIDIGSFNFAKAIIQRGINGKLSLIDWVKEEMNLPEKYEPRDYANAVHNFTNAITKGLDNKDVVFLVERQTFRGGGVRMIPGHIISINRIECFLHSFLLNYNVVPVDPRLVSNLYLLNEVKNKKKAAVDQVKLFLKDQKPLISIPPTLSERFMHEKKKDDLSDCLLQGLAYAHWQSNLEKLHAMLDT